MFTANAMVIRTVKIMIRYGCFTTCVPILSNISVLSPFEVVCEFDVFFNRTTSIILAIYKHFEIELFEIEIYKKVEAIYKKTMATIFNFQTKSGKQKGILSVYILHSLQEKPKSGYDLLKEITEKTEGTWVPSKGTIYPLLKNLEEEKLIEVKTVDKRAKHIFKVTTKGKKTLSNFMKQGQQMREKFRQFSKLLGEILINEDVGIANLIFDIRDTCFYLSKENKDEVYNLLEKCLYDLKKIYMIYK